MTQTWDVLSLNVWSTRSNFDTMTLGCRKASLVARQNYALYYEETFAHVAHMIMVQTLLVVAIRRWSLFQMM